MQLEASRIDLITTYVILHFLAAARERVKRRSEIHIHNLLCLAQYHFNMYQI